MRRHDEAGGSIVGFLITCVVLAVLLVGGIYAAKQSGWLGVLGEGESSQPSSQSGTTDTNRQEDTRDETPSSPNDDRSSTQSPQNSADEAQDEQTNTPAAEDSEASSEQTGTTPETRPAQDNAASDSTTQSMPATGRVLPQTGPTEDAFVSLVAVGSLTLAVGVYVRSRQA